VCFIPAGQNPPDGAMIDYWLQSTTSGDVVLEIKLDDTDAPAIEAAMRVGIRAACRPGVGAITAGNYGGKLGPHHFHLRKILA